MYLCDKMHLPSWLMAAADANDLDPLVRPARSAFQPPPVGSKSGESAFGAPRIDPQMFAANRRFLDPSEGGCFSCAPRLAMFGCRMSDFFIIFSVGPRLAMFGCALARFRIDFAACSAAKPQNGFIACVCERLPRNVVGRAINRSGGGAMVEGGRLPNLSTNAPEGQNGGN